jgi:hypothetical protein
MSASKKANDNSGMSWPHLRARRRSEHIPPSSAILRVSRPSRTKLAVVPEAAKMAKRILAERLCLGPYQYKGKSYSGLRSIYSRCTRCGRGGLAIVLDNGSPESAVLESFYPPTVDRAKHPSGVPDGILTEFLEAELCASFGAKKSSQQRHLRLAEPFIGKLKIYRICRTAMPGSEWFGRKSGKVLRQIIRKVTRKNPVILEIILRDFWGDILRERCCRFEPIMFSVRYSYITRQQYW